jgi:hypothetical protein
VCVTANQSPRRVTPRAPPTRASLGQK